MGKKTVLEPNKKLKTVVEKVLIPVKFKTKKR